MKHTAANLLALWALAVAPNLCRAGVWVVCCPPGREHPMTDAPSDGCCDEGRHGNSPTGRECSSCVNVCAAIAKPPEGGDHASGEVPPTAVLDIVDVDAEPPTRCLFCSDQPFDSRLNLPFRPSDVPLLI
jgi:hypothetical protein